MDSIEKQYRSIVLDICTKHKTSFTKILKSKKFKHIFDYIVKKYQHINNAKPTELFYLFVNNLENRPKCKTSKCNKSAKFYTFTYGYFAHCCIECLNADENHINKVANTKLDRYGYPSFNMVQVRKTNLELYGVEIVNQHNGTDEFLKKSQQTTFKHYGVDHNFKSPEIRNQIKQTKFKKYGDENFNNPEKAKNTKLEKYGNANYNNHEKFIKTMNEQYGVDYPQQNINIRKKSGFRYKYNNIKFDSSWELAYYIWLTDNKIDFEYQSTAIKYTYNNTERIYIPDFKVGDMLIEIKGNQYFKKDGTMQNPYCHFEDGLYEAKHQCMIENNVKILTNKDIQPILIYIENTYGKNYLKSFKNKQCNKNNIMI